MPRDALLAGVFLHVLADTLGSVGVIVSSFLIANLGWFWADPLVSLILACMIGASAWPLLSDTASVLLLRASPAYAERAEKLERKLLARVHGALALRRLRLWQHSATLHFAAVNIQACCSLFLLASPCVTCDLQYTVCTPLSICSVY